MLRCCGKSMLAEAIRYALNQWRGRARFLDDGRVEMDTNTVEGAIRPLVVDREA
jgi:transposase